MNNKGFSLVEMLISLLMISLMLVLSITRIDKLNFEHFEFLNNYLLSQSKAMASREKIDYENDVYFNSMGHVNQARTIEFNNHKVVVHLGSGYATYE